MDNWDDDDKSLSESSVAKWKIGIMDTKVYGDRMQVNIWITGMIITNFSVRILVDRKTCVSVYITSISTTNLNKLNITPIWSLMI